MRLWMGGLFVAACALSGGCGHDTPVQYLADWQVETAGRTEPVHLPAHLGLDLGHHAATYRLRTHVVLDPSWRGRPLTFAVPFIPTFLHLAVNGHAVSYLDEHLLDRVRIVTAHRFRIDAADTATGALDLEITVHSGWTQATYWDTVPRIALGPFGDRWTRIVYNWNFYSAWIALVALLTIAVVFLMVRVSIGIGGTPLLRAREMAKIAGGTALFCATQIGFLQPVIGQRDMAYLFVAALVAVKASVQVMRAYVGLPPLPMWTFWAVVSTFWLSPLLTGGFVDNKAIIIVALPLVGGFAYLVKIWWARRGEHAGGELGLMVFGWLVVLLSSAFDFATSLGGGAPLAGLQLTHGGLLFFVNLQAYILARDYLTLLNSQHQLNGELEQRVHDAEQRNREIESLNTELRRRVGDRSRELSTTLRKLREGSAGELPVGSVLADRYRVAEALGVGAMGAVFRVERLSDGAQLAAKVLRARLRPDALERFTREAEIAARVDHPNVVRVLDVDVGSDGELFLVMELVRGRSLEEERARFGQRSFAMEVLRQVAGALHAIHAAGVVHRDLKPGNVLVSTEQTQGGEMICAKVSDFGVAGLGVDAAATKPTRITIRPGQDIDDAALEATIDAPTASSSAKLTEDGALVGTPLYMAPEVLSGAGAMTPAADLYSFGLIAYQLLGGLRVERAADGMRRARLKPWAEIAPDLDPVLAEVLHRCVREDPTRRPSSRELHDAFSGSGARKAI